MYDVDAPGVISQYINLDALTHEALKAYTDTIAMDLCPRGAVVCTVMVARAGWIKDDRSKEALCATVGLFGLVLAELEAVDPPVKVRGQQGVWEWTP